MGSSPTPPRESISRSRILRTTTSSSVHRRGDSDIQTTCNPQGPPRLGVPDWFTKDDDPRTSTSTYASTIPCREELKKKIHTELVRDRYEAFPAEAIASNPTSFGRLFPSCRKLMVSHDDTTRDGNLNLRVSTLVTETRGRQCEVILFHLRMLDLQERKFSFRRYCRQSGREVCHSARKYRECANEKRYTAFSWANFSPFRTKSKSQQTNLNHLRRQDSGYKSGTEEDESSEKNGFPERDAPPSQNEPSPTNTIKLEFSNYAHVDVRRRGSKISKRYDYEYWSTKYQWRRSIRHHGGSEELSYHLYDLSKPKPVAHIVPEALAPMEAFDEESKGGWVPPSSIWISDAAIFGKMSDIADISVVIATGLIALVDDNIRRRWHNKEKSRPSSPIASTFIKSVESLVSTKLFDKVFQNRWSSGSQHINSIRQLVFRGHGS
ncbi:conserved hypothetical protein [Coccidioides posadasii str. Silveira]|uniref:Uncharacterized protein n=2 Tax=Coccidioides posadasii TaxID=199306 RepID=E9D6W0_COCPS|nr:conserved hypothetical protein [Coccidioides posadasii str. Silveira]KMM68668.1 hypothetical protein CPAG_04993 [Coccidioides posadasii RMSCC 3488]